MGRQQTHTHGSPGTPGIRWKKSNHHGLPKFPGDRTNMRAKKHVRKLKTHFNVVNAWTSCSLLGFETALLRIFWLLFAKLRQFLWNFEIKHRQYLPWRPRETMRVKNKKVYPRIDFVHHTYTWRTYDIDGKPDFQLFIKRRKWHKNSEIAWSAIWRRSVWHQICRANSWNFELLNFFFFFALGTAVKSVDY